MTKPENFLINGEDYYFMSYGTAELCLYKGSDDIIKLLNKTEKV